MCPLHAEVTGNPDGDPIVLLHGFTQTGRLWGNFGRALGRTHRLVLVDLPGHAGSTGAAADLVTGARLVTECVELALGGDDVRFDLLGYSLGGRLALHVALGTPDRLRRMILIGATGGIEDPGASAARRARDEALAAQLEEGGDVIDFVRRWLAAPMFAGLGPGGQATAERSRNSPAGLASSLRLAGLGSQTPVWDRLGSLSAPALLLAGACDLRYGRHAERLASELPTAVFSLVSGARHAAHLQQPAVAARLVTGWLAATDRA